MTFKNLECIFNMPIYKFKCKNCDLEIEEFVHSFKDELKCKNCKTILDKQFTKTESIGFNFVGSGFYCNDYKKGE